MSVPASLSIVVTSILVALLSTDAGASSVRDIGSRIGLPRSATTWDVQPADLDRDGWLDLVISYHEEGAAFYRSDSGVMIEAARTPIADIHGCAVADIDVATDGDRLRDVFCTVGARRGSASKANQLWVQTSPWTFEDRAPMLGVTDAFGRGRHPTFLKLDDDAAPDLFIGNEFPRQDENTSPNRTYLNDGSGTFLEVDVGATAELGGACAQRKDVDLDGRQDLLVCGRRLTVYRNLRRSGHPFLADRSTRSGVDLASPRSAVLSQLVGDRLPELAVVRSHRLFIYHQTAPWRFDRLLDVRLRDGRWVAAGDIDGRHGTDLYVVQGCGSRRLDHSDLLLLNVKRTTFEVERRRRVQHGCGHHAASGDLDRDGKDEFIVLNGWPKSQPGPVQVLTWERSEV